MIKQQQNKVKFTVIDNSIAWICVIIWGLFQIDFIFQTQKISYNNKVYRVETRDGGWKKDQTDPQWINFSENIVLMSSYAVFYLIVSYLFKRYYYQSQNKEQRYLRIFQIISGICYCYLIFKTGILFYLLFLIINFTIICSFYKLKIFPYILWVSQIFFIFLNEQCQGYQFSYVFGFLPQNIIDFLQQEREDSPAEWFHFANMAILRIISFSMDMHWSYNNKIILNKQKHLEKCANCTKEITCLKYLQEQHHQIESYSLINFMAYIFYSPIFITGPPLTYNAWLTQQCYNPIKVFSIKQKITYTLRVIVLFVLLEILLYLSHAYAFCTRFQNYYIWDQLSIGRVCMMGFLTLTHIWWKFNVIWKYARAWAMWDDVEVPENMNRCINNNYTFEGFWRSWHRGFNQWLIRYIFIPLGGSKTKHLNIWPIFTFVAIWHDQKLNLIIWAWGVCLCFMIELLIKNFAKIDMQSGQKYLSFFGGSIWIIFLCIVNLVGFGVGLDVLKHLYARILSIEGFLHLSFGIFVLMGCNIMQRKVRMNEQQTSGF